MCVVTTAELDRIAEDINCLAAFLGPRDVDPLSADALERRFGWRQADVFVLFGGSILAGGDVLAAAMRAEVARRYVIVGGAGHTTETFRARVRALAPDLAFADDAPEADVFAAYLRSRHGLAPDALERLSTNCGNNVAYLLRLMGERGWPADRLILAQDATMQRRMHAIVRKEAPATEVVNYATYAARVAPRQDGGRPTAPSGLNDALAFARTPLGMWDVDRYVALLLGEIPRLRDDEGGYGPRGRGFLAHVDVPDEVLAAWGRLSAAFPDLVRTANPTFAAPRGAR